MSENDEKCLMNICTSLSENGDINVSIFYDEDDMSDVNAAALGTLLFKLNKGEFKGAFFNALKNSSDTLEKGVFITKVFKEWESDLRLDKDIPMIRPSEALKFPRSE